MVNGTATLLAFGIALAALGSRASELPSYGMGDVVTNDLITMRRLLVVAEQATAEIRDREAQKIDLFVVYSTNHAAFIEGEIRGAVTRMQDEFLGVLQENYGTTHLTPEVIGSRSFVEIMELFMATSPGPPVPPAILPLWAQGRSDAGFLEAWFVPLRQVMSEPIAPDRFPAGQSMRGDTRLRLVSVDDLQVFVKEEGALSNSVPSVSRNLIPLAAARRDLHDAFYNRRAVVASFMVNQLQPNCRLDTNLTQRVKDFTVAGLVQMKQFEPGEVVLRKGRVVDSQALVALAEMRENVKVVSLEQQVAVDKVAVQLLSERSLWLAGLLGSTALVLAWVMIRSHRRQRRRELVPVLSSSFIHQGAEEEGLTGAIIVDAPPAVGEDWRRRALDAEQHAAQAKTLARSNLMPHLAEQLKDNAVQQLAAQVDDMLNVQAAVSEQMDGLEKRLEHMHAPLQERLRAYEQRISELEQDLAHRGQENQVLLRSRIEALREQMDQEKRESARVS